MTTKALHYFKLSLLIGIGSFLLLHAFAVLGIFIAISYPLWWLLFPKLTFCFSCRARKTGAHCPFCNKTVPLNNVKAPQSFRSVLLNTFLLLLISVISASAVYVEISALKTLGVLSPQKAVTFSLPTQRQHQLAEIFPLRLEIIGTQTAINAVQTDLAYDPEILQIVDVDITGSFAEIFIQKEIDNERGFFRLSGGLPNPGFSAQRGLFAVVYFQAINPGTTQVEFLPSSLVMANDGRGSNVLRTFSRIPYLITPTEQVVDQDIIEATFGTQVLGAQDTGSKLVFFDQSPQTIKDVEDTKKIEQVSNQQNPYFIDAYQDLISGIWSWMLTW